MKWCKPVVLFCYSFVHSLSIICKSQIHKETQFRFLRIWYSHDQLVKEFIEGLPPGIWFGSKRNLRDQKLCKPLGTKMAQKGTSNCHQPVQRTYKYNALMPLQNRNDTLFAATCTSPHNQFKLWMQKMNQLLWLNCTCKKLTIIVDIT